MLQIKTQFKKITTEIWKHRSQIDTVWDHFKYVCVQFSSNFMGVKKLQTVSH